MEITNSIINYRRYLKRRNYSLQTVKSYLNSLRQYILWIDAPIEQVTHKKIEAYIDFMLDKRLKPKTINCHLQSIRSFYQYLYQENELKIHNPVKTGYCLRLPRPLPRHLNDDDVDLLFNIIKKIRDRAMFKLMLRCGLRVEEVANLTRNAVDLKRRKILVYHGKGGKGRVVYISDDACNSIGRYLKFRSSSKIQKVFLVEKGTYKGKPISIRGIQKRIEYYAKKTGLKVSCHNLRHYVESGIMGRKAA